MTEPEWLACKDPKTMFALLQGKTTDRKLRLFSVACCRQIWDMLDKIGREAVEVAERYTDGMATSEEQQK